MIQRYNKHGFIVTLTLLLGANVHAQSYVTYGHDEAKMNQITVMETGAGGLTPTAYYTLLHDSYQKSAASKNKMSFRTLAGVAAYQQVADADSVKSSLVKRAEIEALNVADRQIDIAWLAESSKVTNKMSDFEKNINRIISAGGNMNDKERWTEYYNMFQCAVKATQDAYMPNSERKKQYLAIYKDLCKQNDILIAYIVQLNNRAMTADLLSATNTIADRRGAIATAAHNRWREAGWRTNGQDNSNGSGGTNISGSLRPADYEIIQSGTIRRE